MKIGIITLYNSTNYGAFLQGYALQRTLINMGNEVSFINFTDRSERLLNFRRNIISKQSLNVLFNIKRYLNYNKAYRNLIISKTNYLVNKEKFDIVIIGSDEMWNVTNRTFKNLPIFFGGNINANIIATYAISCGQATLEDLRNYPNCIKEINNIKYLSGRDSNTVSIIEKLTNKDVEYVLDPTLLYNFYGEEEELNISENFILIYSYGFDTEQINRIKEFARKRNLITVSPGFNNKWCDKVIPTSPFGFLSLVKNAKYIITNTFHGSLFSIIYKKDFVVLGNNKVKINDMLEKLNLASRISKHIEGFDKILNEGIDYIKVEDIIKDKKNDSIKYLKKIINSVNDII